MKFISSIALLLLLFHFSSSAQRTADYTAKFDKNLQSIVLNKLSGHVIIKESDKISDFNPETNTIEWSVSEEQIGKMSALNKAKKINEVIRDPDLLKLLETTEIVSFIENSSYIKCTINGKEIIINSTNGAIVFNSGNEGYRILSSQFLPYENQFLFSVIEGKDFKCVLYDLKSGSEKWSTLLGKDASMFKSLLSSSLKTAVIRKDIIIATDKIIYSSINNKLYKIDKETGKIYWSPDYDISRFYLSQKADYIIITKKSGGMLSRKQGCNVINSETGTTIWKDDIETKNIAYLEDWGDKFLIAHSSGFNFYTYESGEKIWKKDAKGDDIKKVISVNNDYLYIADNEMNLIDKDGKSKWKSFIEISDDKTDPVYYLDVVDNNRVFYLTGTYGNMVDYTTGKKIWKRNIAFKKDRPLLYAYDEKTKSFLVYNDEELYKFDPNGKDKPEAFAKLKVKNDKALSNIELFDWGVSLVGENEVIGVNTDGTTKFQKTYEEPGETSRRLLKTGGLIGAGYFNTVSSMEHGIANAETVTNYRNELGELVEERSYLLTDESRKRLNSSAAINRSIATAVEETLLKKVESRFKALKQNEDYAFIFARGETDETNYLVKVRKVDGVEVDKIAIDNNKPIYDIDPINDNVYYAYKNELRVFSKK